MVIGGARVMVRAVGDFATTSLIHMRSAVGTRTDVGLQKGNRPFEELQQVAVGIGCAGECDHCGLDRPMSGAVVVDRSSQARDRTPGLTGAGGLHVKPVSRCAMHPGKAQTGAEAKRVPSTQLRERSRNARLLAVQTPQTRTERDQRLPTDRAHGVVDQSAKVRQQWVGRDGMVRPGLFRQCGDPLHQAGAVLGQQMRSDGQFGRRPWWV